jgi:putative OPT family oligopeptide transporter
MKRDSFTGRLFLVPLLPAPLFPVFDTLPFQVFLFHFACHDPEAIVPETQPPAFRPFVPPEDSPPEFTLRALLLGSFFGLIFGAVTVYVGLRAGLTVAASIPIAVLSISILRAFGRSSILENNIVQTTGNAGQSIASGVIFTLPALVFLGFDLEPLRIFMLSLIGGWIGVLFMIPLRRQLIVQEHATLPYPEGTACADVLIAGEKGGALASRVFLGLGLGGIYTFFQNGNLFSAWPEQPAYQPDFGPQHVLKGASINADATSEYLGVGYIIGPRVAGIIFAGGVLSWLVIMPLIYFFGKEIAQPIYPGLVPIAQMTPGDLWATYR